MSKRFAFLCGFIGILLAFVFLSTAIAKPPTDDMKLWLKASLGVTLNGSTVSKWADQSSSKADAS